MFADRRERRIGLKRRKSQDDVALAELEYFDPLSVQDNQACLVTDHLCIAADWLRMVSITWAKDLVLTLLTPVKG
jgi:hypothetical protein